MARLDQDSFCLDDTNQTPARPRAGGRAESVSTRVLALARPVAIEVVGLLFNHAALFSFIGLINRRLGIIESVFVAYPATSAYARATSFPWRARRQKWTPWLCGIAWQNRRLTLLFGIWATDDDIHDHRSDADLVRLDERLEQIRRLVGARQRTFAGILPGVMARRGIRRNPHEREITAAVVVEAIGRLRPPGNSPVVVLGGRGFIGSRVVELLGVSDAISVDLGEPFPDWIRDQPALVLNVADRHTLGLRHLELWPGVVLLNEVYPEPRQSLIDSMTARGIEVHHIAGVAGASFPPFPGGYRGAIPCCAAWASADLAVRTHRLS